MTKLQKNGINVYVYNFFRKYTMAVVNSENAAFDEKLFLEIKNKCAIMGLDISKEGFMKYRDNYIELVKKYDAAAVSFLFSNNQRHRKISKDIMAKDNIPEFMAYVKVKQILMDEFNTQIANHSIEIVDNQTLKHLAEAEALYQQQQAQVRAERVQKEEQEKARMKAEIQQKAEERRAAIEAAQLKAEQQRREAIERAKAQAEARRKEALEKARLREEAKQKEEQEKARLKAEQQRKAEQEELRLKVEQQRKEIEAKREAEEKKNARQAAQKKRREERRAKFEAKWNSFKNNMFSISASFKTAGKSISNWGGLLKEKISILVTDSLNYKKKTLERQKAKYKLKKQQLKKVRTKTLKVAAVTMPFVIGSYCAINTISVNTPLDSPESTAHDISNDTLSSQQKEELEWEWEASTNRDIDDSFFLNDTLSYGVLSSSPNMALFSKCFDECNRRLGEEKGYGITEQMFFDFNKESSAMAKRYAGFLWRSDNLISERIVAKAQIFDKYDIASFHNPNIASYMYNLVLQQNNDSAVHRVQALADGIRDFYDISGRTLSEKQIKALDNLSDFHEKTVKVDDWHQIIATINSVIDPNEEKALFEHIKSSVADAYISFIVPQTQDAINTKRASLYSEKKFYSFVPVVGADTYEKDSTKIEPVIPTDATLFNDISFNFADNDLYSILQKPIVATSFEEQANAKLEADIATFRRLHMQAYHDIYIKMQYGSKNNAFIEANKALKRHGKGGLVNGYFCSGTSIACLCIASDKMKEIDPDNYVSKAVDEIVRSLTNPHYCNSLQQDLNRLAIKTLGKDEAGKLYNAAVSSLLNDCTKKMRDDPNSFMYVWTVRFYDKKTGEVKYHHQACLPALNAKMPYTYAAFNGNHWDTNTTKFKPGLSGRDFNMGLFIYKAAELEKNRDIERYAKDHAADNTVMALNDGAFQPFTFIHNARQNTQ